MAIKLNLDRPNAFAIQWLFILLHVLFFIPSVISQPTRARITTLGMKQDLSGLAVKNMYIDASSKLWIETENGLDLWDGLQFHQLNPPSFPTSTNPLRPANVECFAENAKDIFLLYKLENQFFDIYDKKSKSFRVATFPKPDISFSSQLASKNKQGNPWIMYASSSEIMLYSLVDNTKLNYPIDQSKFSTPQDFIVGQHGFWLLDSTYRVLYLSHDLEPQYFDHPQKQPALDLDQISQALLEDQSGHLWYSVRNASGLFKLTQGNATPEKIDGIPNNLVVVDIWEDQFQRKLIALSSQRQIVRDHMIAEPDEAFKPWLVLADQSILPTKLISDDFHSLIYYGTHQGLEIIKFNENFIQRYLVRGGIPSDQYGHIITSLSSISSHQIIASTENSETFSFDSDSNTTTYVQNQKMQLTGQFATYCAGNQTLSSAHKTDDEFINDLITYNLNTQQVHQASIPTHIISIIEITNNQILIVGTNKKNLNFYLFDTEKYSLNKLDITEHVILAESNISYMYFDPLESNLYVSTFDKGLLKCLWKSNNFVTVERLNIEGLADRNIISISRDNVGNLLVGSYQGLYIVDSRFDRILKHISMKDGLSNNIVAATLQDKKGFYWVSTFSGLNVVDTSDYHVGNFFIDDGISYDEFNRNAALKIEDGRLLFGTGNGFVTIDPERYHQDSSQFALQFSQAHIRTDRTDKLLDSIPDKPMGLTVGKFSYIDIQIGNDDWGMTEDVTYHYRVAGLDDQWQKTKESQIRIDRLPEGRYEIEIKGLSPYGRWSNNVLSFPVVMRIPFFQRTWVRLLLLAIILSLLGMAYILNNNQKLQQRLKFQKRVSDLELSLLQSQMNPHFIFNALGAIQFYIFNNQKEVAEEYLSKFAGLMRMFLESSRNKFISLTDEIKLLKGYVELEHMRFPNRFDSNFQLDLEDSTDSYQLPAMLFQPFLENSINHGIFHNKEYGILSITFRDDNDALYCTIEDNGIGREAAKNIRVTSLSNHKSRSTQITEERIEVLKEAENMHIEITYHDFELLRDGHTGTRVEIRIPFLAEPLD